MQKSSLLLPEPVQEQAADADESEERPQAPQGIEPLIGGLVDAGRNRDALPFPRLVHEGLPELHQRVCPGELPVVRPKLPQFVPRADKVLIPEPEIVRRGWEQDGRRARRVAVLLGVLDGRVQLGEGHQVRCSHHRPASGGPRIPG